MNENMIFGIRPVIEAVKADKQIDKLFVQKGLQGNLIKELMQIVKDYRLHIQYVPVEKLNRLTPKNHQGVIAVISPITFQQVEYIVPFLFENGQTPLIVVLDRITDVRNFGAIARTCECCGVHAIVIPEKESAQINSDAMKASAGALHKISICKTKNLEKTLSFLKSSGLTVYSCTEKTDDLIFDVSYVDPVVIIMGSEENGISVELMKLSDGKVKIPMYGTINSLNVSVATGMILTEVLRQRKG